MTKMASEVLGAALPLLYIDDSPDDQLLLRAVIRRMETRFTLYTVDNPASAAAYFQMPPSSSGHNSDPRPALVLLDYDLGGQTGAGFLRWLRLEMKITSIPVVMYSGSSGSRNVSECYANGANHFLRKTQALARLQTVISTLNHCMSFTPPRFEPLTELSEYEPDPRTGRQHQRT
jgi:CheY-like chemotaxis protein